ncbi:UNVERIFIED_CONTAM: DNA-directed RNA polymerase sigma subunit (sigma70/sigma32) [Paenibacillus phyllosphaerae]
MISIGTIGLIKAIESFQQGKGTKLATFAARLYRERDTYAFAEFEEDEAGCIAA